MTLKKGEVPATQLELLLSLTGIVSPAMIDALRLYLCEGLTQEQAAKQAGVAQSLLSRRLTVVNTVSETVSQLAQYY